VNLSVVVVVVVVVVVATMYSHLYGSLFITACCSAYIFAGAVVLHAVVKVVVIAWRDRQ